MPRRSLAVAVAAVGVFALLLAAAPPPGPAGPGEVRVKVDLVGDGPAVEGPLALPAVTLTTSIGTMTVDMDHVRRITLQKDAGGDSPDTVQLADKTLVRGRVTAESFAVGGRVLRADEVRELKVVRAEDTSFVTLGLGLLTLAAMEIVLGIDNIIFLAIVAGRLPPADQPRARKIGLAAALGTRLVLLFSLSFLLGLTTPVFTLPDLPFLHDMEAREVSWRDVILVAGGLFLVGKSVFEMHEKLEHAKYAGTDADGDGKPDGPARKPATFARVIATIAVIDIVFSLDSVITAVGMVDTLWVMVTAMVIAMGVMLVFAGPIARFVDKHPTIKVLALSFLILIGVMLVAEGLGQHIDKAYIYFAMAFGVAVEMVNMRLSGTSKEKAAATAELPEGA